MTSAPSSERWQNCPLDATRREAPERLDSSKRDLSLSNRNSAFEKFFRETRPSCRETFWRPNSHWTASMAFRHVSFSSFSASRRSPAKPDSLVTVEIRSVLAIFEGTWMNPSFVTFALRQEFGDSTTILRPEVADTDDEEGTGTNSLLLSVGFISGDGDSVILYCSPFRLRKW